MVVGNEWLMMCDHSSLRDRVLILVLGVHLAMQTILYLLKIDVLVF